MQTQCARDRPGSGADGDGSGSGDAVGQPSEGGSQCGGRDDPMPERRDLAWLLATAGHNFGCDHQAGADHGAQGARPGAAVGLEAEAGQCSDTAGEDPPEAGAGSGP